MTPTLQPERSPQPPRATRAARRGQSGASLPGPRHRNLGVVIGLLVGAAGMLVVAILNEMTGTEIPVLSTLAQAPAGDNPRLIAPRPPPPATPGTCLNWRRPDAADAEIVDCGRQHLFEQAGSVALADLRTGNALPDNQVFRQLVNERCTPLVIKYLGGKYDPNGAFRAGALKPSAKRWAGGDRSLRCGLQRFSRSGALYPITGKVSDQDQADIRPAGTCLGIDGRFIGDPVDCALPHSVESVGAVDLGEKFKSKFPSVSDQDGFLQPACSKLAADYAGGAKVISDKKLSVLWDNLTQESWNGGTRKVGCNLAAQLPDKSGFAPVTGSVKGTVEVSDQAAPPARPVVPPGAPAPATSTDPNKPLNSGSPPATSPEPAPAEPPPAPGEPPPAPPAPQQRNQDRPPVTLPEDKLPADPLPGGQLPKGQLPKGQLPKDQLPKDQLPVLPGQQGGQPRPPAVPPNPLGR